MGGGSEPAPSAGGTVCGLTSVVPRLTMTFGIACRTGGEVGLDPRTEATLAFASGVEGVASVEPRIDGTAAVEEC